MSPCAFCTQEPKRVKVASLPVARSHIAASTFIAAGKVFVVGGATLQLAAIGDITSFDPATGLWTHRGTAPAPRFAAVAGTTGSKFILSTGSFRDLTGQAQTWSADAIS